MADSPTNQSNGFAPFNTILSALADETRRHVLQYFRSSSRTVAPVEDLVDYTLAQNGAHADPERVAVKLHHTTLPMLNDVGLLEYDAQSDCVRYRENSQVEDVLSLVTEIEGGESENP